MSWSRALGEFGATIMFAGNIEGRTQTLPLVVYSEFGGGDLDASVAAAAILVLAAFGVLVSVRFLRWGRALDMRGGCSPGSAPAGRSAVSRCCRTPCSVVTKTLPPVGSLKTLPPSGWPSVPAGIAKSLAHG